MFDPSLIQNVMFYRYGGSTSQGRVLVGVPKEKTLKVVSRCDGCMHKPLQPTDSILKLLRLGSLHPIAGMLKY